jgi:hypothetical protein
LRWTGRDPLRMIAARGSSGVSTIVITGKGGGIVGS